MGTPCVCGSPFNSSRTSLWAILWTSVTTAGAIFLYWSITLRLEKLLLLFLKAQRGANFDLYVATLGRRAGWFFTMYHYHYARWLSVHVRDLMQISVLCPSAYTELSNGKFVTHKTANVFSALAHDQVHEQLKAVLKGDRGIVGITKADKALRR